MKKFKLFSIFTIVILTFYGCTEDETAPRNDESIIPETFLDRDVIVADKDINLNSREITISVWDEPIVDGDIISIYINGEKKIDKYEILGIGEEKTINVTLKYEGYNYILLYAHNTGDTPPNTCKVKIQDNGEPKIIELESNLNTNGAFNLIVN